MANRSFCYTQMPAHTVPLPWEPAPKPNLAMLHCLPRVKKRVFPPLSSEGPCYEVLRVISGVSVPQASLFQSSPGDVICKVLLPMTTGFTCPGPGPSPSSISPKAQLSLLNLLSQEQPQELSVLFITSEDGNDRGMVSLEHVILTFLFFPPKIVFIILNINPFHEGIPSTSLLGIGGESLGSFLPL